MVHCVHPSKWLRPVQNDLYPLEISKSVECDHQIDKFEILFHGPYSLADSSR